MHGVMDTQSFVAIVLDWNLDIGIDHELTNGRVIDIAALTAVFSLLWILYVVSKNRHMNLLHVCITISKYFVLELLLSITTSTKISVHLLQIRV